MRWLAQDPRVLIVGQAVKYPGQSAFPTFEGVPMEKRLELPVAEDFQMGFCTGLAIQGTIPVSFYPRWDFLILAANQLLNHLDKAEALGWGFVKQIIRVAVGRTKPLDPGPQHTQNYSHPIRQMLKTVSVMEIFTPEGVMPAYEWAMAERRACIMVEYQSKYS